MTPDMTELYIGLVGFAVAVITFMTTSFQKKIKEADKTQVKNENVIIENSEALREQSVMFRLLQNGIEELRKDLGGIREQLRQLSQIDIDDRTMAMHEHNKIWKAISELEIVIRNIEEKEAE